MIRHWQISTQSKETLLYRHQQVGNGKAKVCTDGVAKEAHGDAGTYDSLVVQGTAHDWSEWRRADEGDTRNEGSVGVDAEDGTEQHMEEQGSEGGYGDKEEKIGTNLGECAQAYLRCYRDTEDEYEESASLEGASEPSDASRHRGENGKQADGEDEDALESRLRTKAGDGCSNKDDSEGEQQGYAEVAEVVFPKESEEELTVMVVYRYTCALCHLVVLEVGHKEAQYPLTADDDQQQVYGTHHGAIGGGEDVCGVVYAERNLQRCKIGVATRVESREHSSDSCEELGIVPAAHEEACHNCGGTSEESEDSGLEERGSQSCPRPQVGGEEQQRYCQRYGCRSHTSLHGMHLVGIRNQPRQSQRAPYDISYDDASHLAQTLVSVCKPQDEQRCKQAYQYYNNIHCSFLSYEVWQRRLPTNCSAFAVQR